MSNFLFGVLASLIAAAIWHFLVNRERDVRIGAKVFDITKPDSEDQFYVSLRGAIAKAQTEVIQYAEGFATSPQERLNVAKDYVGSIRQTLIDNPKLTWTRIQTRTPCSEDWFNLLRSLVAEFPTQFKLYLVDNRPSDHTFSVAALIDPGLKCNQTFLLISKPKNLGGPNTVNIGDIALKIRGSQKLSKSLDEQLNRMRDPNSKFVESISGTTEFSKLPNIRR